MNEELGDAQRATLRERLHAIISDSEEALAQREQAGSTVELDQSRQGRLSRMDAMQGQAMQQAAAQRARQDLVRARAALARIDRPDYGWCSQCDERIADARLQLDPASTLCIGCAQARESGS